MFDFAVNGVGRRLKGRTHESIAFAATDAAGIAIDLPEVLVFASPDA
jgi:hypothetical protein